MTIRPREDGKVGVVCRSAEVSLTAPRREVQFFYPFPFFVERQLNYLRQRPTDKGLIGQWSIRHMAFDLP
jgi:hypothetical protein